MTVTATGPVAAQAVTALDGTYRFADLPPGTYALALAHDGLQGHPPLRGAVLPGPETYGLDFEATAAAPLLPSVRLAPSAPLARPGETFTVRLTLTPGTQEPRVDFYLFLVPPGASLRPAVPWQSGFVVPSVADYPVVSHTLNGTEPPGTYTWFAFLTRPRTLELLGPVASAAVVVGP